MGGTRTKRKRNKENSTNDDSMWSSGGSRSKRRSKSQSTSSSSSDFDAESAEQLFDTIADPEDPTIANMEGISKLCDQLDIDPFEDVRVLVLLWKLGSQKPAQLSKEEWMESCERYGLDSIEKFRDFLPSLELGFLETPQFKEFYKFCFRFNLHSTHRTLDKDMVVALWRMVLPERMDAKRLDTFATFVETQTTYTRITLDQWTSFLEFSYECPDLSAYDESTSAWPVLIDEYVEYMAKNHP
eukprot:Nitzschia sp. Nitz4//scaffold126_size65214//28463//29281//NITZ4_006154-RA/size65214-processed-gene-0.25-mRNA-1//1//CDS//3329534683//8838//frame0